MKLIFGLGNVSTKFLIDLEMISQVVNVVGIYRENLHWLKIKNFQLHVINFFKNTINFFWSTNNFESSQKAHVQ